METLKNLNKFWRSSTTAAAGTCTTGAAELVCENEDEEEESLFELEMLMLNCRRSETRGVGGDKEDESLCLRSKEKEGSTGRRVVPMEPDVKPQSPISILKAAPKLRVSLFRKPKTDPGEPDLKISTLVRESGSSGSESLKAEDSSKRFSKEVMQKYLKLKLSKPKRSASVARSRLSECPASQLAKSRSASSGRRDESLAERDDGIQSAILHCKRSFNSSRESSMLFQIQL
uniref:Membrane-associated kinase regulator 2 n=1 Tax=Kalanchoe fedtschenkoi TaxID=63787 RepID=A0A7N0RBC9_KALFE